MEIKIRTISDLKVEFDFLLTTAEQLAKDLKIIEKEKGGDIQRVTSNEQK